MARCGGTGVLPVYPLNGNTMNSSIFLSLPFRRTSVCVALTSALVSLLPVVVRTWETVPMHRGLHLRSGKGMS